MNILRMPIEKVKPWAENPRGIKTKDYERLKRQILELGVYKPLLAVKENGHYIVLGGNMRIRALKEIGIKEIEISIVQAKTKAQKIKYALSDNDRAGFYEEQALAELIYPHLAEIKLEDYKIDLGEPIDLKQVVERFGPDIDDGADDVPEIDDTPAITKPGDLFMLGRHRLLCGDSTKAEDVARLMRREKADAIVTDPPYGVGKEIANDRPIDLIALMSGFIKNIPKSAGIIIAFQSPQTFPALLDVARSGGWRFGRILWLWKPGTAFQVVPWHGWARRSEAILVMERKANWPEWVEYVPDMYAHEKGQNAHEETIGDDSIHPTVKPLWVVVDLIRHTVGNIFDPFLGSGTTLIAAEKLNRICYGMEIDPKYCDVIIKRYADYVGVSEESIRKTVEHGK